MTVREVIEELQKYDEDQNVKVFNFDDLVDVEEVAENVVGGDVVIWCGD